MSESLYIWCISVPPLDGCLWMYATYVEFSMYNVRYFPLKKISSRTKFKLSSLSLSFDPTQAMSDAELCCIPTAKISTLMGYEYVFLGYVKNGFCWSGNICAENILSIPCLQTLFIASPQLAKGQMIITPEPSQTHLYTHMFVTKIQMAKPNPNFFMFRMMVHWKHSLFYVWGWKMRMAACLLILLFFHGVLKKSQPTWSLPMLSWGLKYLDVTCFVAVSFQMWPHVQRLGWCHMLETRSSNSCRSFSNLFSSVALRWLRQSSLVIALRFAFS